MAAILNFAWEECFDTNLRTPSTFFFFCSLFWTFWYRWYILTIKIPREFIYEHKHTHYFHQMLGKIEKRLLPTYGETDRSTNNKY